MAIQSSNIGIPNIRKREDMVLDSNTSLSTTYNSMNVNESNMQGMIEAPAIMSDTEMTQEVVTEPSPTPTSSFASRAFGDLELTKYLYESGLQNIFSDYQRNIQTLQQEQSKQLQQAYVAREMSKKYLGEYASNIGIGDVSGSLIDIYSQYASNISNIDQNFAALEMNLTREYTTQRMNTFENLLRTQYQLEVAQLDDVAVQASQYVFTEFDNDVLGGLNYLESQQGNMNARQYEAVRDSYYRSNVESIIQNISSEQPYFGFADLETRTMKTQEQYLEEAKRWMEPTDYRKVEEAIALREMIGANRGEMDFGDPIPNIDATLFSDDVSLSPDSDVYMMGNIYFGVSDLPILDDMNTPEGVDSNLLNKEFEAQSGQRASQVVDGDIVQYQGFYMFKDGAWRRMLNIGLVEIDEEGNLMEEEPTTSNNMEQTSSNDMPSTGIVDGEEYQINVDGRGNLYRIGGRRYVNLQNLTGRENDQLRVRDTFDEMYGEASETRIDIIKISGIYFSRKGPKIWRLARY